MTDNQREKIQRVTLLRKHFGIKQDDFARLLGLNRANLSSIENFRENRTLPNATAYVLEKELNVNPLWFETGDGDMLLPEVNNQQLIQQPTEGYIPVYDIAFSLGFTPTFIDSQNNPEILGYVNFPELRGSTYVVQAKGSSMAPLINDRDYVGIRPVKNKRNIDFGNPYGIVTEDLAVFKKIRKVERDPKMVLLTSENPEFDPFEITKEEIIHLFSVIGILSVKSITY